MFIHFTIGTFKEMFLKLRQWLILTHFLVLLVAWICIVKYSNYNLNGQVDFSHVVFYSNLILPNMPDFLNENIILLENSILPDLKILDSFKIICSGWVVTNVCIDYILNSQLWIYIYMPVLIKPYSCIFRYI